MAAPASRLDRRAFLRTAAGLGTAIAAGSQIGWLAGCGDSADVPSETELRKLSRMLHGRVVTPGDPGYGRASRLYNPRFDGTSPRAVAYPESRADVRRAVLWARDNDVSIVARNGGHSYGGYSVDDGLVTDLTRMKRIEVDAAVGTARIGAGSLLIDVYAALARRGVTIPAGSCPTVGVTGLTLGGGIGLSGRKLGLTCDSLVGLEMVTADGETLRASERQNPDLFWASRGGGGGNFGIVTSLEFRVHPVGAVAIYELEWSWRHARTVFEAWQRWAPQAPDEIFSICKLSSVPGAGGQAEPTVTSFGQCLGSRRQLEAELEPLLAAAPPSKRTVREMQFLDAQLHWAGCEGSVAACIRTTPREPYKAKSDFVSEPFGERAIDTMVRWVERWPGSSNPNGAAIQMDASGGAINRVPEDATAYVHRDDLFHCQYLAYWGQRDPQRTVDANLDWIASFYEAMRSYVSGRAYQNYIDPDLGSWPRAYYGDAFERLQGVNAAYDPDNVFDFRQAIS